MRAVFLACIVVVIDEFADLIMANISACIALKMASKSDSRIILDQYGAEQLLGQGDMLVSQESELQRIHGAYVSEDELNQSLAAIL